MLPLFENENLLPFDGCVIHYAQFIKADKQNDIFEKLIEEINWKQEGMKMYGKEILFPRLTAWYSSNNKSYKYSGVVNEPQGFTSTLLDLKNKIETLTGSFYNSALLNYYRTGNDSMGWHSDDEKELGQNPNIASLSFGATRKFQFKHKTIPKSIININLESGSLLIMKNETQHNWLHQIPKVKLAEPRINITFRNIL